MAQANVNIRMDAELKNNLDQLCNELGLTISTAVTIFAKAMVRNGGIPFDVRIATPNKETLEAFQEIEEMKSVNVKFFSLICYLLSTLRKHGWH